MLKIPTCLNILLVRQLQGEPFSEINEAEWCLHNPNLENMEVRLSFLTLIDTPKRKQTILADTASIIINSLSRHAGMLAFKKSPAQPSGQQAHSTKPYSLKHTPLEKELGEILKFPKSIPKVFTMQSVLLPSEHVHSQRSQEEGTLQNLYHHSRMTHWHPGLCCEHMRKMCGNNPALLKLI